MKSRAWQYWSVAFIWIMAHKACCRQTATFAAWWTELNERLPSGVVWILTFQFFFTPVILCLLFHKETLIVLTFLNMFLWSIFLFCFQDRSSIFHKWSPVLVSRPSQARESQMDLRTELYLTSNDIVRDVLSLPEWLRSVKSEPTKIMDKQNTEQHRLQTNIKRKYIFLFLFFYFFTLSIFRSLHHSQVSGRQRICQK